ncbi:MAG: hypothetical protein R2695_01855 [Acidimicrobiales bacterium]
MSAPRSGIGVYPGSFDPPTRAHLEIAQIARRVHGLARADLAVSTDALGKDRTTALARRPARRIRASILDLPGIGVVVTGAKLIVDVATGYDVVVMGADNGPRSTIPSGTAATRTPATRRSPGCRGSRARRPPFAVPAEHRLPVADDLLEISSTASAGRTEWMTDAARLRRTDRAWTRRHR